MFNFAAVLLLGLLCYSVAVGSQETTYESNKRDRGRGLIRYLKRKLTSWRESIRRRKSLLEERAFWRDLADKCTPDFDVTQMKFEEWRGWTGDIVDEFHEFQANTSLRMQRRIANSIKQINEARDKLTKDLESRAKTLRKAMKHGRFTVIHHVDSHSFNLAQLKKILRAQRQVQEVGHRYVILYWTPEVEKEGEKSNEGHYESLQRALPREGRNMLFKITPADLRDFEESEHRKNDDHEDGDGNLSSIDRRPFDCFLSFSASHEPLVSPGDGNETASTFWRRRCADRLATTWLLADSRRHDEEKDEEEEKDKGGDEHMRTQHYWLLDISVEWVGSLPRMLARWHDRRGRANRRWKDTHYLGACTHSVNATVSESSVGSVNHTEHHKCHAELQRLSFELLQRLYRPLPQSSPVHNNGTTPASLCGAGARAYPSNSTFGLRAGLDCSLTLPLAQGQRNRHGLEYAAGNLLDIATREGILGADFSAPQEQRGEGGTGALKFTTADEFEHAILSHGHMEGIGQLPTEITHSLYPPLALLGRLYREVR